MKKDRAVCQVHGCGGDNRDLVCGMSRGVCVSSPFLDRLLCPLRASEYGGEGSVLMGEWPEKETDDSPPTSDYSKDLIWIHFLIVVFVVLCLNTGTALPLAKCYVDKKCVCACLLKKRLRVYCDINHFCT
jgi:hypothetical protein